MRQGDDYLKASKTDNKPIYEDRDALLRLYENFQAMRRHETTNLRETVKFFEIVISALCIGSITIGFSSLSLKDNHLLGMVLSGFAASFSVMGLLEIRRVYIRFLRWRLITWNVEELLGLHARVQDEKVGCILIEEYRSKKKNEELKKALEGKSFIIDGLRSSTLLRTYTLFFVFFILISALVFLFRLVCYISLAFVS